MRFTFSLFLCLSAISVLAGATLDQSQFPASGKHHTLLHIDEIGRYAISAKSGRGVQLTLADRMAGPIASDGIVGERDGRVDHLLDVGTYKVWLEGPASVSGDVTVEVVRFEGDQNNIPQITNYQLYESSLNDLEARHFWLVVPAQENLRLEIMGRNLSDVRIWLPGEWLTGIRPTQTVYEPTPGQPMTHMEFHHAIRPGQYLVSCYGGPAREWANEGGNPLYLRQGVRDVGTSGVHRVKVSPFGREAFFIGGRANYVEVRRDDKLPTRLTHAYFQEYGSRYGSGQFAMITKDSRVAHASISGYETYDTYKVLWVQAEPGAELEVAHFLNKSTSLSYGNDYLLTTQDSLLRQDSMEPTGLVYYGDGSPPVAERVMVVGPERNFARRMNLLQNLGFYLYVTEDGPYVFTRAADSGVEATISMSPVDTGNNIPPSYPTKEFGDTWDLVKGYYQVMLKPDREGILNFAMHHQNDPTPETGKSPDQVAHSLNLRVDLTGRRYDPTYVAQGYHLRQYSHTARALPLDLQEDLPFYLAPGEELSFTFRVNVNSKLYVEGDPGEIFIGEEVYNPKAWLKPGTYAVRVSNPGERTGLYQFYTRPLKVYGVARLLANWGDVSSGLPILRPDQPQFTDFSRRTPVYYLLQVPRSGLYRLETSGRLATSVFLRSRVAVNLFDGHQNGVGRNGLVQQYLRAGTYLVTVIPQGQSKGRAGVHLRRGEPRQGEPLVAGVMRKTSLEPDEAIIYPFQLEQEGEWQLRTMGLGKSFQMRLEDEDGFPIFRPGITTQLQRQLDAGSYRVFSLPEPLPSRRLFILEAVESTPPLEGKGPHALTLNQALNHQWRQGAPDVYTATLPAPAIYTLSLTKGMRAQLLLDGKDVGTAEGGTAWSGYLQPGKLTLHLQRTEKDDYFPYDLTLSTSTLMDGVPFETDRIPPEIPISIGEDTLVDIEVVTGTDVYATLEDAHGKRLAVADDSADDWNFRITRRLAPGYYRLLTGAYTQQSPGLTRFTLTARPKVTQPSQSLPFQTSLDLGRQMMVIPLQVTGETFLQVALDSDERVALAVTRDGEQIAQEEDELHIALSGEGSYALLVWYPQAVGGPVTVRGKVLSAQPQVLGEGPLKLSKNGPWKLNDDQWRTWTAQSGKLLFASSLDQALQPVEENQINLFGGQGYLLGKTRLTPRLLANDGDVISVKNRPLEIGVQTTGTDPTLIWLRGVANHPAAMLISGHTPNFTWQAMARSQQATLVGTANAGNYRLRLWPEDSTRPPGSVHMERKSYPIVEGSNHEVPPGKAHHQQITGTQNLHILLSKGMVAMLHHDGQVTAMASALDGNQEVRFPASQGTLFLINTGDAPASFRVKEDQQALPHQLTQAGWEHRFTRAGTHHLSLAASDHPLHVMGEGLRGKWMGQDGRSKEFKDGDTLPGEAGLLELHHADTFIKLWYAATESRTKGFLSLEEGSEPLAMGTRRVTGSKSYTVEASEAGLLDFQAPEGALLALWQGETVLAHKASERNTHLSRVVEPGTYTLMVQPIAGATQLRATMDPLKQVTVETLAPWHMIGEGERQVWAFSVSQQGKVGIGLEADQDQLNATLYDANFKSLGSSPYILRSLDEGRYFLVVEAKGAVRYRPVLHGADGPKTFIPEDVLNKFLD